MDRQLHDSGCQHGDTDGPDDVANELAFVGGVVQLWRLQDGDLPATLQEDGAHITGAAFAPDDQTLATVSSKQIQLWRVADGKVEADPELTSALVEAGPARPVTVVSTDLFYDPREGLEQTWLAEGAEAVEMEAAAILSIARRHGLPAACLLAVSDLLPQTGGRVRLEHERIADLGVKLGGAALRALAQVRTR